MGMGISIVDREKFLSFVVDGNQEQMDFYLMNSCQGGASFDDIRFMVDNGANPLANNSKAFCYACGIEDVSVAQYFIYHHRVDLNSFGEEAMSCALSNKRREICKLLMDNGVEITDENIKSVANGISVDAFNILLELGIDPERIAKIFMKYNFYGNILTILKLFIENNVDLNQTVLDIAKTKLN